jgi:hypothetical protein
MAQEEADAKRAQEEEEEAERRKQEEEERDHAQSSTGEYTEEDRLRVVRDRGRQFLELIEKVGSRLPMKAALEGNWRKAYKALALDTHVDKGKGDREAIAVLTDIKRNLERFDETY